MRRLSRLFVVVGGLLLSTTPVAAHQVGSRFDAPIPLSLLFAGAGVTVAVTALLLARTGSVPDGRRSVVTLSGPSMRHLRVVGRALFLAAFAFALVDGVTGPRAPLGNFATLFVWPVLLNGVALLSVLVGSPWRWLSPWRTVYDALVWLEGDEIQFRPYPRLGEWPALVGFLLLVGIGENLTQLPQRPTLTAGLFACYALVMLLGGIVFGPDWFDHADPLAVLYRLLGWAAPFAIVDSARLGDETHSENTTDGGRPADDTGDMRLVARVPWHECLRAVTPSTASLVVAAVYTVSFDGFAESPEYRTLFFEARDLFGLGPEVGVVLYLAGLVVFLVAYVAIARLVGLLGDLPNPERTLAASVVPIAAAYAVAHNFDYVVTYVGQLPQATGSHAVDFLFWLPISVYWGAQVLLVVVGHVVAVVAAHEATYRRVDDRRRALLAHLPLVALMVGYTVLSLWIISRPVAS